MAEIDIAAVFQLLGSVAQDMRAQSRKMDSLTNDVASMRQTLTEYHASVLGHGVMISNLEDRVRRIERHLNLPSAAAE